MPTNASSESPEKGKSKNRGIESPSRGKKSRDDYYNIKQRAKEARIFVDVKKLNLSILYRHNWKHIPIEHQNTFKDIQTLGRTQYDTYTAQPTPESSHCPWQQERSKRAQTLAYLAERSLEDHLNEAGWRFRVEGRLFERFDIEVACKQCRKRLWRSEIEASPETSNSRSNNLEKRQSIREACVCPLLNRKYDALDIGIGNIFSERTQEACIDPDGSFNGVTKEPDRIHGLNMTNKFEKLLGRRYCHGDRAGCLQQTVDEAVPISINPVNGGKPLLYPFLIMEAKSEKSGDSFAQIEAQTCFPIRHALRLQHSLMRMPGNRFDVPGGPLVWFFANKGESWRVYGAYMRVEEDMNEPSYGITRLWEGTITGQDEAIQLVCIVDYIIDWARDIYRPNIMRQLKSLGTDSTATLSTLSLDNDFYSIRNDPFTWAKNVSAAHNEAPSISNRLRRAPTTDIENSLDADNGIIYAYCPWMVRDASKIESRVRGLFIMEDNVQTLLQIFDTEYQQNKFQKIVKSLLDDSCIVLPDADVLGSLEAEWMGQPHLNGKRPYRRSLILARIRTSFFVGPEFELVRELTYLAITEPAYRKLLGKSPPQVAETSDLGTPSGKEPAESLDLVQEFHSYCKMRERDHLSCCLARRSFRFYPAHPAKDGGKVPSFHVRPDTDPKSFQVDKSMQDVVHRIYETCRIGRRKPKETFLRNPESVHRISPQTLLADCHKHTESVLAFSPAFTSGQGQLSDHNLGTLCLYSLGGRIETEHSWIVKQLVPLMTSAACIVVTDRRADATSNITWGKIKETTHCLIREGGTRFASSEGAITCDVGDWIMSLGPSITELEGHLLRPQSQRFDILVKFAKCCEFDKRQRNENPKWRWNEDVRFSDYHRMRWNYTSEGWHRCDPSEIDSENVTETDWWKGPPEILRHKRSSTNDGAPRIHPRTEDKDDQRQEPSSKRRRIGSAKQQIDGCKQPPVVSPGGGRGHNEIHPDRKWRTTPRPHIAGLDRKYRIPLDLISPSSSSSSGSCHLSPTLY